MLDFSKISGFQWDKGNRDKIWKKHRVSVGEAEQVFFNEPFLIGLDEKHSTDKEIRYLSFGVTNLNRELTIVFTIRKDLIRVISARDMSKKDRREYEKRAKQNPSF